MLRVISLMDGASLTPLIFVRSNGRHSDARGNSRRSFATPTAWVGTRVNRRGPDFFVSVRLSGSEIAAQTLRPSRSQLVSITLASTIAEIDNQNLVTEYALGRESVAPRAEHA